MTGPLVVSLPSDRAAAEQIVDALVEADLSPRWVGSDWTWRKVLAEADAAPCVVFILGVWAKSASLEMRSFRRLVAHSLAAGLAIGVRVAPAAKTLPFGGTVYDVSGWRMSCRWWSRFLVGGLYLSDVAAAAKFKCAGRDPPPPAAPRRMVFRHLATVFSAIVLPLVAILSFTDVTIGLYGASGVGNRPTEAARRAWEAIPEGNCEAFGTFAKRTDAGELHDRAEQVLAGSTLRPQTTIDRTPQPIQRTYIPPEDAAFPIESDALAAATSGAVEDVRRNCSDLAATSGARFRDLSIDSTAPHCQRNRAGYFCMIRIGARCLIDQPVSTLAPWCSR